MNTKDFIYKWNMIRTEANGCRLWTGRLDKDGYGVVDYTRDSKGKLLPTRVPRLLYELRVGPIPEGKIIKHTCDVPQCVALEHLELGTYSENNKEGYSRGRHVSTDNRGEGNANSVLTESDVVAILCSSDTAKMLAERYGVSKLTIEAIWQRKLWKHLDVPKQSYHRSNAPRMNSCKLTLEKVLEIRSSKLSSKDLATKFGVSVETVRNVLSGRTWNIERMEKYGCTSKFSG